MTAHRVRRPGLLEVEGRLYAEALADLLARFPSRPNAPTDDDYEVFRDSLDGASGFPEAAAALADRIKDREKLAEGVWSRCKELHALKAHHEEQAQAMRERLASVLRDHVLDDATRSFRPVDGLCLTVPRDRLVPEAVDIAALPPDLVVRDPPTLDLEAVSSDHRAGRLDLDARYLLPSPPRADMAAIRARVARGEEIPGVVVARRPQSLQISTK